MVDFTLDQARRLDALLSDGEDDMPTAGVETVRIDSSEHPTPPGSIPENVGPYRILGILGQGGMGAVYTARDDRLDRDVAIKAIRSDRRPTRAARERFLQEARALLEDARAMLFPLSGRETVLMGREAGWRRRCPAIYMQIHAILCNARSHLHSSCPHPLRRGLPSVIVLSLPHQA